VTGAAQSAPKGGWAGRGMGVALLGCAVLVAAVLLQVLRNDWVWDDRIMLGPDYPSTLSALPGLLRAPFWAPAPLSGAALPAYWRPLTTFVFWLAAALGGAAWVGHALSVLGAAFAASALYALLRALRPLDDRRVHGWLALVYLAHPVTAEATCMALNVSDHLALGSLLWALRLGVQVRGGAKARFRLPGVFAAVLAACAAKEFGVLGALVPLGAWLLARENDTAKDLVRRPGRGVRAALWAVSLVPVGLYALLRARVLQGVPTTDWLLMPAGHWLLAVGAAFRQIGAVAVTGASLPLRPGLVFSWATSAAVVLGLVALWVGQLWRKPRRRVGFWGLLVGLALFAPSVLGSSFAEGSPFVATRYVHLLLAGVVLALAPVATPALRARIGWLAVPVVLVLAVFSLARVDDWRDEERFFGAEHRAFPLAHAPWHNLLAAQLRAGHFDEAEATVHHYTARKPTLTVHETGIQLHTLARIAWQRDGDLAAATALAHRALLAQPADIGHLMLLVEIRAAAGRPEEGMDLLHRALNSNLYTPSQVRVIEANRQRLQAWMTQPPP